MALGDLGARAVLLRSLMAATLSLIATAGCNNPQGGTDVGNGAAVALDLRAYEEGPAPAPQSITLSDGATVDGLWMVMDRVRLRPGVDCSDDADEVDEEGPLVADLLGAGIYGGPAMFPKMPGSFCRLRIDFHRLTETIPTGAPPELAGRAILMTGARADGTPFTVASEMEETLELRAKDGAFALAAGDNPLFLAYEIGAWMAALDLSTLPAGTIVISKDDNQSRLKAFEDAVSLSARLFRDEDRDGALSPAERAPGSEIATPAP